MEPNTDYAESEPSRSAVDALTEPTVIEFGAPWCGHCLAAQPLIASALAVHLLVRRIKIEDGPGRALGRSFCVKRWPTLIFLQRGREVARLVRPAEASAIEQALMQIDSAS